MSKRQRERSRQWWAKQSASGIALAERRHQSKIYRSTPEWRAWAEEVRVAHG